MTGKKIDFGEVRPTAMSLTISTNHYFWAGAWVNLKMTRLTDEEIDAWMALGDRRYDEDFDARAWILGLRGEL